MMIEQSPSIEETTKDDRLLRLYRYWEEKRGRRPFPARSDIDPLDFPYALGRVSMIDVLHDPLRFRYRLVSTQLTEHLGYEMTGKFVEEIPDLSMQEFARAYYERALACGAPHYESGTVLIDRFGWRHETLSLPLSSDGQTIDMLLIYRNTSRPEVVTPPYRPA